MTAWCDEYGCDTCSEEFETTVSLPGVPWGERHDTEHAGQAVPSGTTLCPGLGDIRARIALD